MRNQENTDVTFTAEYRSCVIFEEKLITNDKMDEDEVDDLLAEISVFKIKLECLLNLLDDDFQVNINEKFLSYFNDNIFSIWLQLEILQRQVTNLADSQNTVDDRTTRTKTEHAVLQARYDMLEEQLRDVII